MPASALAGVLGLLAGCCAVVAACVTLADWRSKSNEARWLLLQAVVDRADVIVSASGGKDDDRTATTLRYRVRYEAAGGERTATLVSRSAFSETDAARLQAWAIQHRKGATIEIRSDPWDESRAAFAAAEVSDAVSRVGIDLILLILSVLAAAGLIVLSKYLERREALALRQRGYVELAAGRP